MLKDVGISFFFLASEKVKEHIPWSEKKTTWSFCVEHLKILEYLEVQF